MATNNADNFSNPVGISYGGSGNNSFTSNASIYYDGSKLNSVAPGTTGNVLTSNGPSLAASFKAFPNNLLLINSTTISSPVSSVVVSLNSSYHNYYCLFSNVAVGTAGASITISGTAATRTATAYIPFNSTTTTNAGTTNSVHISTNQSTSGSCSAVFYVLNAYNGSNYAHVTGKSTYILNAGNQVIGIIGSNLTAVSVVTSLAFLPSSGNFTSGTISVFAMVQ